MQIFNVLGQFRINLALIVSPTRHRRDQPTKPIDEGKKTATASQIPVPAAFSLFLFFFESRGTTLVLTRPVLGAHLSGSLDYKKATISARRVH